MACPQGTSAATTICGSKAKRVRVALHFLGLRKEGLPSLSAWKDMIGLLTTVMPLLPPFYCKSWKSFLYATAAVACFSANALANATALVALLNAAAPAASTAQQEEQWELKCLGGKTKHEQTCWKLKNCLNIQNPKICKETIPIGMHQTIVSGHHHFTPLF